MMVCVMVAMVAVTPSYAQRLIPRQNSVELVGSIPIIKGRNNSQRREFWGRSCVRTLLQAGELRFSLGGI